MRLKVTYCLLTTCAVLAAMPGGARAATLGLGSDPTAIPITISNASGVTSFTGTVSSGQFAGTDVDFSTPNAVNISGGAITATSGAAPLTELTLTIPADQLVPATFTDLNLSPFFTGTPPTTTVTVTGSDGLSASANVGNGSPINLDFSATNPLTSAIITATNPSTGAPRPINGQTGLNAIAISGLAEPVSPPVPEIPLPASLPLFATGLVSLGLLGWRRQRKSSTSILTT